MADETKDPSTEGVTTPTEGQEALTVEPGTGEAELTPEQIEAQEEHKERSKLGRRVSTMEQMIRDRDSKIDDLLYRMETMIAPKPQVYSDHSSQEDGNGDDYITKKDLPKYVDDFITRKEKMTEAQHQKYQIDYRRTLNQLGSSAEDPDFHSQVVAELEDVKSPFNKIISGNPNSDAELNYYKASMFLLKAGKPTNPLKGGKPPGAIGVGGDSKIKPKDAPMPKLSKEAAEFATSMGLTPDKVKKYLE